VSLFSRTEGEEPLETKVVPHSQWAEDHAYGAGVKHWRDPERQDKIRLAQVHATLALREVVQELVAELRHRRNGS
jgi:hypothetical protein